MSNERRTYAALAAAERRAWMAIEGRLPGNPDFNQQAWDEWRSAVKAVASELGRHRELADLARRERRAPPS